MEYRVELLLPVRGFVLPQRMQRPQVDAFRNHFLPAPLIEYFRTELSPKACPLKQPQNVDAEELFSAHK